MDLEGKKKLLLKPFWTCRDISTYLDVSPTKATEIKRIILAKEADAQCLYNSYAISSDAVLRLMLRSSRENELRLCNNANPV